MVQLHLTFCVVLFVFVESAVIDICSNQQTTYEISEATTTTIQSPNKLTSTTNYAIDLDCKITLTSTQTKSFIISYREFNVEPEKRCDYDKLTFTANGQSENVCGYYTKKSGCYFTDKLELDFHSDESDTFTGFTIDVEVFADADRCICHSTSKTKCIFPFIYNGKTYYQCSISVNSDISPQGAHWCATEVDDSNHVNKSEKCDMSLSACVVHCTVKDSPTQCIFPFKKSSESLNLLYGCSHTSSQFQFKCATMVYDTHLLTKDAVCDLEFCVVVTQCKVTPETLTAGNGQLVSHPSMNTATTYPGDKICGVNMNIDSDLSKEYIEILLTNFDVLCIDSLSFKFAVDGENYEYLLCGSYLTMKLCIPSKNVSMIFTASPESDRPSNNRFPTGFGMNYSTQVNDFCSAVQISDACLSPGFINETTDISSPFYPYVYPGNLSCVWIADAGEYHLMKLTKTDFEVTQSSGDVLRVINSDSTSTELSSGNFPFCSSSQKFQFEFTSASRTQYSVARWKLKFEIVTPDNCGRCTTVNKQDMCKFPFEFEGILYEYCTKKGNHSQPWCYNENKQIMFCDMKQNNCKPDAAEISNVQFSYPSTNEVLIKWFTTNDEWKECKIITLIKGVEESYTVTDANEYLLVNLPSKEEVFIRMYLITYEKKSKEWQSSFSSSTDGAVSYQEGTNEIQLSWSFPGSVTYEVVLIPQPTEGQISVFNNTDLHRPMGYKNLQDTSITIHNVYASLEYKISITGRSSSGDVVTADQTVLTRSMKIENFVAYVEEGNISVSMTLPTRFIPDSFHVEVMNLRSNSSTYFNCASGEARCYTEETGGIITDIKSYSGAQYSVALYGITDSQESIKSVKSLKLGPPSFEIVALKSTTTAVTIEFVIPENTYVDKYIINEFTESDSNIIIINALNPGEEHQRLASIISNGESSDDKQFSVFTAPNPPLQCNSSLVDMNLTINQEPPIIGGVEFYSYRISTSSGEVFNKITNEPQIEYMLGQRGMEYTVYCSIIYKNMSSEDINTTVLTAPSMANMSVSNINFDSVEIEWILDSDQDEISGFELEITSNNTFLRKDIIYNENTKATTGIITVSNLEENHLYSFLIQPFSTSSNGEKKYGAQISIDEVHTKYNTSRISIVISENNDITMSWNFPSIITLLIEIYKRNTVKRSTGNKVASKLLNETQADSFTFTELDESTEYDVQAYVNERLTVSSSVDTRPPMATNVQFSADYFNINVSFQSQATSYRVQLTRHSESTSHFSEGTCVGGECSSTLSELWPGTNYSFDLVPFFNKAQGPNKTEMSSTLALDFDVSTAQEIQKTEASIELEIPMPIFEVGKGVIHYVLIIGTSSEQPPLNVKTWFKVFEGSGEPYQATPEKLYPPNTDSENMKITLGGEDCTKVSTEFCNGYLTSDTDYWFWIRGYGEHNTSYVETEAFGSYKIHSLNSEALVFGIDRKVFILVAIVVGVFITFVIMFCTLVFLRKCNVSRIIPQLRKTGKKFRSNLSQSMSRKGGSRGSSFRNTPSEYGKPFVVPSQTDELAVASISRPVDVTDIGEMVITPKTDNFSSISLPRLTAENYCYKGYTSTPNNSIRREISPVIGSKPVNL